MNVTMLISPSEGQPGHVVARSVASRLLNGLCRPLAEVVPQPGEQAAGPRGGLDLVAIVASVGHGPVSPALLDALAERDSLAGCVAFLAAVGPWPAEVGTADRVLRPRIHRAGALCVAPTMHVVDDACAPIAAYCRYWRSAVTALSSYAKGPVAAA
jgi:hypothetical protein